MTKTPPLSLPNTRPGGMEAHVHTVPVPVVDDRVIIGPIEMPMREFCELVKYVIKASPLKENDPRIGLVEHVQRLEAFAPATA